MRKFLEKLITNKENEVNELRAQIKTAETADEVRSLGSTLDSVLTELQDAKDQLAKLDESDADETKSTDTNTDGEERANIPANAEQRGVNVMATYSQTQPQARQTEDVLDSMEYRNAFAQYVRTGEFKMEKRADEVVTTEGIGKVIPNTVMKELIKTLKSYGNLYNRVRKLNVKGGVEFPIEDLIPTVSWITETTPSNTQKAPELKTSVSFGYHIAEARIAQSLLSSIVSLDLLESEIAKLLAEAFVKEFDRIIIAGTGSGQPTGILNDTRVPEAQKVQITEANAVKWASWRKLLFAKIPLAYRAGGVILMTVDTWESLICTMADDNNRPLYSETYNVETNTTTYRFNGKEVMLVESDLGIVDYSTATEGQVYMVYLKPENYAINSNLQIGFKRYFNEDLNKWVNKGLCIMDGKLLDTIGVFIVRK
jgi:HK97 family phage major capsid protein